MKTQIGAFCLWCLALHAVNLLLFLTAICHAQGAWDRAKATESAQQPSRRLLLAAFATGTALAGWQVAMLALFHAPTELTLAAVPGHANPLGDLLLAGDSPPRLPSWVTLIHRTPS